MVLSLGIHSYCQHYKESGDLGTQSYCHNYKYGDINEKQTIVGNYTSINDIDIKGWANYGHNVGEITHFPFGWHAPHLTNVELFQKISLEKITKINRTTIIGSDVWIGENVTIKCGCKIGDGVIVGYNSNVTNDIPPYCVVGGNPARIIKKRYSDEIITKLLEIKWWLWSEDKIKENSHWFINGNMDEFVDKFYVRLHDI
jgi:acetyltransferase-like isoleucine patch superfamily enzyme